MTFTPEWMICQTSDFKNPAFRKEIELTKEEVRYHRKQWEYAYVLSVADRLGLISNGIDALGIGVLQEPVVDAMASRGSSILATDLAMFDVQTTPIFDQTLPVSKFHHASVRGLNGRAITPESTFKSAVRFKYLDILNESSVAGAGRFNLVWSCAVLPHLGSLGAIKRALDNSQRMLRPGGWALHTFDIQFNHRKGKAIDDLYFLSVADVAALFKSYVPSIGWRRQRLASQSLVRSKNDEDRCPETSTKANRHICARFGDLAVGSAGIAIPAKKDVQL